MNLEKPEATMSRPGSGDRVTREGRRDFLKGAAVAGGAVTVVAATAASAAATDVAQPAADGAAKGYHETPHIRSYYKTAAM